LNEDYPESHNSIADIHHHDGYQEQEGEDDDEGGLFEDVHQGVNFTNILRTAFFIPKCFAQLFCTHSFAFVIFYGKNIDAKAARKMLVKLTKGQHRHEGRCIEQTAHEPKVR